MKEITLDDMRVHVGQEVLVRGWLSNKRSSGAIIFLQIRDGFGFIQAVCSKSEVGKDAFEEIGRLTLESSIKVWGKLIEEKRSPEGYEIEVTKLDVLCLSPEDYPIQKKRDGSSHSISFLMDNRHFHLREKRQWAIQRVRNTIINSMYECLNKEKFIKIDSPIFTPNACEGTTTLFEVDYLPAWEEGAKTGPKVYLSQSGQLYLEAAIMSLGRVFDFGPVFRAEKSKTRRHLTEFWMMDAEAAFYDHRDNIKLQEKLTKFIIKNVLEKNKSELKILARDTTILKNCLSKSFEIITHKDAVKILQKLGSDITEREDLGADDETILTKQYNTPIFVEKYPKEVKAFYMKEDPKDSSRLLCSDMLAPEGYGEVIGGSQREDDYDKLIQRINDEKLNMDDFKWYLDLRKYGSVPHSGFGVGLERYIAWICGLKHIRETIPFPRLINRIKP